MAPMNHRPQRASKPADRRRSTHEQERWWQQERWFGRWQGGRIAQHHRESFGRGSNERSLEIEVAQRGARPEQAELPAVLRARPWGHTGSAKPRADCFQHKEDMMKTMNFCPQCGSATQPATRFCASCGAVLAGDAAHAMQAPTPTKPTATRGVSVFRIALGVVLGIVVVWYFFPGLLDPSSHSLLGSENRRSPLANIGGPKTVFDETITLDEDQYGGVGFRLDVPGTVSITATHVRGPRVELYVLDKSGYQEFDAAAKTLFGGGQFHHFPDLAGVVANKATVAKSGGLRSGEYHVLFDNSDFGKISPPANFKNDVAEVRLKLVVE